jgi:multimeric flavodoxin WrbA
MGKGKDLEVLGICGSPVMRSSTEILIKEVLRGAESGGARSDYILLNELDIMPCQACGQSPDDGYCFFSDGMDIIYEKFDRCDAVVVGSPIYFDSVSAQTKLFIDRTNCFRALTPDGDNKFIRRIAKKRKGAIILVGGEREDYEHARVVIGGFFAWADIEPIGMIKYACSNFEKGSAKSDPDLMKKAFDLGIKLTG